MGASLTLATALFCGLSPANAVDNGIGLTPPMGWRYKSPLRMCCVAFCSCSTWQTECAELAWLAAGLARPDEAARRRAIHSLPPDHVQSVSPRTPLPPRRSPLLKTPTTVRHHAPISMTQRRPDPTWPSHGLSVCPYVCFYRWFTGDLQGLESVWRTYLAADHGGTITSVFS